MIDNSSQLNTKLGNYTAVEFMDVYDTLPAALRKVLQDIPYNMQINPTMMKHVSDTRFPEFFKERLKPFIVQSAREAYGASYPIEII